MIEVRRINLGELAKAKGLRPYMGLSEARERAEQPTECLVCHRKVESLSAAMVYRYGQCSECLKG